MKHNPERVVHFRKSKYDVYIGRPSIWGNPVKLEDGMNREEVVMAYRLWLLQQPHLLELLPTLKGKVLGCWCSPKLCHGDVIMEMVIDLEMKDVFA